jgi:hypothetical protein
VDHALLRGFIEFADSLYDRFFGFRRVRFQSRTRLADSITGSTAGDAVTQAALLVLLVSFDLRLNVSQGLPPKFLPFLLNGGFVPPQERYFTLGSLICPEILRFR